MTCQTKKEQIQLAVSEFKKTACCVALQPVHKKHFVQECNLILKPPVVQAVPTQPDVPKPPMESIMVAVMARSGNHDFVHVEQRRWSIKECKTYKIVCKFSLALRSNVKIKNSRRIKHWHQHCTWLGHWSDDCFAQSNNPNPCHDSPIMTLVKYTKQTLVKNNGNRKDMIKMCKLNQCLPNNTFHKHLASGLTVEYKSQREFCNGVP